MFYSESPFGFRSLTRVPYRNYSSEGQAEALEYQDLELDHPWEVGLLFRAHATLDWKTSFPVLAFSVVVVVPMLAENRIASCLGNLSLSH